MYFILLAGLGNATSFHAAEQDYNLKLGPFYFDLTGTFTAVFNDNLNVSGVLAEEDIILSSGINFDGTWQFSNFNKISMTLGATYQKYINHPELDSKNNFLQFSPNTEISFTMLVKNFTFRYFDQLTYSSDATDSIAIDPETGELVIDILQYARFENTAGVNVEWDLNQIRVNLGYTRLDIIASDKQFENTERTQQTMPFTFSVFLSPNFITGLQGSVYQNEPKIDFLNKSTGYGIGPFVQWEMSKYIRLALSGNWTIIKFDQTGSNEDFSDSSEFNLSMDLYHTVNSKFFHHINFQRSTQYGFISNFITLNRIGYKFKLDVFRKTSLNGHLGYMRGRDSGGRLPEKFDRFNFGLSIGYALSEKLSWTLRYASTSKSSNLDLRDFNQNIWDVGFSYDL